MKQVRKTNFHGVELTVTYEWLRFEDSHNVWEVTCYREGSNSKRILHKEISVYDEDELTLTEIVESFLVDAENFHTYIKIAEDEEVRSRSLEAFWFMREFLDFSD